MKSDNQGLLMIVIDESSSQYIDYVYLFAWLCMVNFIPSCDLTWLLGLSLVLTRLLIGSCRHQVIVILTRNINYGRLRRWKPGVDSLQFLCLTFPRSVGKDKAVRFVFALAFSWARAEWSSLPGVGSLSNLLLHRSPRNSPQQVCRFLPTNLPTLI